MLNLNQLGKKLLNKSMDKKSKILLTILLIITIASVSYTFYKTLIQQDFEVVNNIEPIEEEASQEVTNTEPVADEDASQAESEVLDTDPATGENVPQAE